MKKAKIYKPSKTVMQSGNRTSKMWILKFDTQDTDVNPLTGWETSKDTMSEVILEFTNKESAIKYAKKNNIDFYLVEPQKKKTLIKSYNDNFLKNN